MRILRRAIMGASALALSMVGLALSVGHSTPLPEPTWTPIAPLSPHPDPTPTGTPTASPIATRSAETVPTPRARIVETPRPTPRPTAHPWTGSALRGQATWYRWHVGEAAAGPALRRMLGPHWRGKRVQVCASSRCVVVRLTDWCACHPSTRLVDLDARSFAALAPLSRGVIRVTVR